MFPPDYPYKPPSIKFKTPIYNPGVSKGGEISIDILGHEFSPALTIRTLLLSITSLINSPDSNIENAVSPEIQR